VRRVKYDEDVNAVKYSAGGAALDVIGADDIQAEMALNEAAKGAVVVEAGNVQVGRGGRLIVPGVHVLEGGAAHTTTTRDVPHVFCLALPVSP
jgi:hypothetical protein